MPPPTLRTAAPLCGVWSPPTLYIYPMELRVPMPSQLPEEHASTQPAWDFYYYGNIYNAQPQRVQYRNPYMSITFLPGIVFTMTLLRLSTNTRESSLGHHEILLDMGG